MAGSPVRRPNSEKDGLARRLMVLVSSDNTLTVRGLML